MDEGLYLYKGLLYNEGTYRPFQDYGPLSNQMPLAFLIPGFIQKVLGPGLQTGRYFAVFLAGMGLLALYLTSRRLGGSWIAAAIVWIVALNPATEKIYSMAIAEGIIACFLMWVLFLTLGEKRPTWQLVASGALAGVMVMVRINVLPLLPLLALYLWWQYGWKPALLAGIAGLTVIITVHALYWPNILRLWAYWLPQKLVPFLSAWEPPAGAPPLWDPQATLAVIVTSFFAGFRYHFVALVGALTSWILWPARKDWHSDWEFRAGVFLSALLAALIALHVWASLANNYCLDCYPIYTAFYAGLGLLLIALCFKYWRQEPSRLRNWATAAALLFVTAGLAYTESAPIAQILPNRLLVSVLKTPMPRLREMRIAPGTVELWAIFANKFHVDYEDVLNVSGFLPRIGFGILAGALMAIALLLVSKAIRESNLTGGAAPAMVLFLLIGLALSPFHLLGGDYQRYDCASDVLRSYAVVGDQLQAYVPAGAQVFWMGYAPSALLYLPNIEIFPSQLNGDYSFRLAGDPQELTRYGWWNKSLGRQWLEQADVVVVYQKYLRGWLAKDLASERFQQVGTTDSLAPCLPNAQLLIFRKTP